MKHRKEILKRTDLPQNPAAQIKRLEVLSESFRQVRDEKEAAGKKCSPALETEYDALFDVWRNLDLACNDPDAVEAQKEHRPATDPLTQLKFAAAYGVIAKDVEIDLQRQFRQAVKEITGIALTPGEIKRMHHLMTHYNPFKP